MEDYEKDALFGLTVKLLVLLQDRRDADEFIKQAQARLMATNESIEKARAAASVFGVDPDSSYFFTMISEALGRERFSEAIERSGYKKLLPDTQEGEVQTVGFLDSLTDGNAPDDDTEINIKELVLKKLRQAGKEGAKARDIIDALREEGWKMHDKTVGMTLYRLSKDDPALARREGHMWYPVEGAEGLSPPATLF